MKPELFIDATSVVLRKLKLEDAPKFFRMSHEDGMRTWIPSQVYQDHAHAASVLEYLIKQYDSGADPRTVPIVLPVQLKTTGEVIGHVGLSPLNEWVEIGFAVEHAQQRKGLATEAVKAVCAWATSVYPIKRIHGITAKGNVASQGVLQKAGFGNRKEQLMFMQGAEQPVVIFEYSTA